MTLLISSLNAITSARVVTVMWPYPKLQSVFFLKGCKDEVWTDSAVLTLSGAKEVVTATVNQCHFLVHVTSADHSRKRRCWGEFGNIQRIPDAKGTRVGDPTSLLDIIFDGLRRV